jgi:monoterpene epsilon-lactone hydrolase
MFQALAPADSFRMRTTIPRLRLAGPLKYRERSLRLLSRAAMRVSWRRRRKGPLLPGWNWFVEVVTQFLKDQLSGAFELHNIVEARRFLDTLRMDSPALRKVNITPVLEDEVKGDWFTVARDEASPTTLLYCHGGGYSLYPKWAYAGFIAEIALATNSRTFALNYRLTPEHGFPAQLEDALAAYRWLLKQGVDPRKLVVAGDSAGGNLTLALMLALRERNMLFPALAICLSPATEFVDAGRASIWNNAQYDWVAPHMLLEWADWFCAAEQRNLPLVSPINADLHGLPPIYIQAGRAEILYDSIEAFVAKAKEQGADVTLEAWDNMTHVFQMFGHIAPQSVAALGRMGEVIDARLRRSGSQAGAV